MSIYERFILFYKDLNNISIFYKVNRNEIFLMCENEIIYWVSVGKVY